MIYWDSDQNLTHNIGPGNYSNAEDINNNGVIVGNARMSGSSEQFAAVWDSEGNLTFLNELDPAGNANRAWSISDDGLIVGYSRYTSGGDNIATISYDGLNVVDLNTLVTNMGTTGFVTLNEAYDINANGDIVGVGTLADGTTRAFVLTAVPVPAAVWLFGSALGALGWLSRRKNRT